MFFFFGVGESNDFLRKPEKHNVPCLQTRCLPLSQEFYKMEKDKEVGVGIKIPREFPWVIFSGNGSH